MKKTCNILIVILLTTLLACSKNKTDDGLANDLIGNWELANVQASITPTVTHPAGQGNFLSFDGSKYYIYENHQLVKEGNYTVVTDGTVRQSVCLEVSAETYGRRIIFDNDETSAKTFFKIADQQLITLAGCFSLDGGVQKVYNRIQSIDGVN